MSRSGVVISVGDPGWRDSGLEPARVRTAARLALARGLEFGRDASHDGRNLTVLLTSDNRLHELNLRFRGMDHPTNVLSFPAPQDGSGYLGDVAVALGAAAREAQTSGKTLLDHVLHLTVHGVLHLLGYDHQKSGEARTMERLEIAILRELGVANPYALHA